MKLTKTVSIVLLLAFIFSGCSGMKTGGLKEEIVREVILRDKADTFEKALVNGDNETLWSLRSKSFKKLFSKHSYFEYLKSLEYLQDCYSVTYSTRDLTMKGDKATISLWHSTQCKADGDAYKSVSNNFWVYEEDDWYLDERSYTAVRANDRPPAYLPRR